MDSLITSISAARRFNGGKEDGVASVQRYFGAMFGGAYAMYYDVSDSLVPAQRTHPCIGVDQIDYYSDAATFFNDAVGSAKGRRERLQMYFRCIVTMDKGGKRAVRRMRDQVFFVLTHAGTIDRETGKFVCPPIMLYRFDTDATPTVTDIVISLDRAPGGVQDRFVANFGEPHLVQYDVMARFEYLNKEDPVT